MYTHPSLHTCDLEVSTDSGGMHETSRYINSVFTLNSPDFEQLTRSTALLGIYPHRFQQSQVNRDANFQASQVWTPPSSPVHNECLVLERVQPKPGSHEVSTDKKDYLDVLKSRISMKALQVP